MNASKNSGGPSGILTKNNLVYSLPPDLSVAVERRTIRQYSQGTDYVDGQRCTFVLNTGADFVDFTSSYLTFDFALTGVPTGDVTFSRNQIGSACNVINRITVSTRSGDEITRIDNCNVLASQLLYTDYDSDYFNTIATSGEHMNSSLLDIPIRCLIPLERLSGFFKYDKLAPSPLCSGLRIKILFENAAQALNSNSVETVRYKITQPSLVMEQHRLTDAVSRAILSEAASNGLEVVVSDWFHSLHTTAEATVNAEVRKAVSRAQKIMAVPRVASNENRFDENGFIAPFNVLSWRYRLGSSYFPNQPITSTNGNETPVEESYYVAARTFGRHRSGKHMKMTTYDYVQSHGILSYPLERQASLDLSGIPVNNSRILSLDVKFAQSQSRLIDFYMKRVLLCRVFLSNTETEE